jgi:hypothetical protein
MSDSKKLFDRHTQKMWIYILFVFRCNAEFVTTRTFCPTISGGRIGLVEYVFTLPKLGHVGDLSLDVCPGDHFLMCAL